MAVTDLSLSVSPLHDEDHISSGLSLRPVEAALEDPAVRRRRFSVSVVAVLAALAVVAGTVAVVVLRDDSVGRVPNSPMDMNPKKTGGVANTNVALLANADGKVDTRLAGYCGQDAQCTILNTVCVEGSCYCPEGFYAVLTGEREELEDVECQEGETYYYAEETAEDTDEPTLGTNLSPDDLAALIADTGSYAPLDPAPPPNVVEADAQKNFYQYYDDDETSNLYTTGLEAVTDAFPPEVLAGEMNMERAPTDENDEGVEVRIGITFTIHPFTICPFTICPFTIHPLTPLSPPPSHHPPLTTPLPPCAFFYLHSIDRVLSPATTWVST
jgi:hypothetical protein